MFWKYTLFEMKLILHNRRNWFLGLLLLLFFPLFFMNYSQSDPVSLEEEKKEEANIINAVLDIYPESYQESGDGKEIYESLLKQSSIINYQIYYFWEGDPGEDYIEDGLALNELRLRVHELENKGIPDWGIKSEKEILKENARLTYMQKYDLPVQTEALAASVFLVNAFQLIGGLLFYFFVLVSGSEVLVSEQQHHTVINGFPLAFMKKVISKTSIYFAFIFPLLILGLLLGGYSAYKKAGMGDLNYPVLLYGNGDFEAISTIRYLLYGFLAMALVTVLVLYLSVLLNMIFKNAYANILIGLGFFLLPGLFRSAGVEFTLLNPIRYVEISKVMSGDLAAQLGDSHIDYWHAISWLAGWSLLVLGVIYMMNKWKYVQKSDKQRRMNDA